MEGTWEELSREPREPEGVLTDRFVMKYDRFLNWNSLSNHYNFSIDMLRCYFHKVNWSTVLKRNKLPEYFLREMAQYFDADAWIVISKYQVLSENFIHDFADKLDWDYILLFQDVNYSFLDKHRDLLQSRDTSV